MKKVFISTSSFGVFDSKPIDLLKKQGLEVILNDKGRKLKEEESQQYLRDVDYLIAGTEMLSRKVLFSASKLKIISRCGGGIDNVDLETAKELNISVLNTPDAPTLAVAELALGLILSLLRKISMMDRQMREGVWEKQMGNLLTNKRVGVVGFGRIGKKIVELLKPFNCELAYFDHYVNDDFEGVKPKDFYDLLKWADIVTIHVSAAGELIGSKELCVMRESALIINASRGGNVNQGDLFEALYHKKIAGAALDVFDVEPYSGELKSLDNIILTPHIGSYAKEGRINMEKQAVENLLQAMKKGRVNGN